MWPTQDNKRLSGILHSLPFVTRSEFLVIGEGAWERHTLRLSKHGMKEPVIIYINVNDTPSFVTTLN